MLCILNGSTSFYPDSFNTACLNPISLHPQSVNPSIISARQEAVYNAGMFYYS